MALQAYFEILISLGNDIRLKQGDAARGGG